MFSTGARADDYVSVRGAYYREASTRVIQQMVEVVRESPSGLDVAAHFPVDAIVSYKYSSESDYWSHSLGGSFGVRFWEDTAAIRLSLGHSFDTMTNKSSNPTCQPNMPA